MAHGFGGHAEFFEHEDKWAAVTRQQLEALSTAAQVHSVRYDSDVNQTASQFKPMPKPTPLDNDSCDVTVVDSPQGWIYGRGQSLSEGLRITKPKGVVFLDDAIRQNEQDIAKALLTPSVCASTSMHRTRFGFRECQLR